MANLSLIKILAKEKKITLKSLSEKAEITEQGLQKILKENTTSIATLEKISSILGVSPAVFFDDFMPDTEYEDVEEHPLSSKLVPHVSALGDHAIAVNGNVKIQQQLLDIIANKDAAIAEKDARIKELTDKLLNIKK